MFTDARPAPPYPALNQAFDVASAFDNRRFVLSSLDHLPPSQTCHPLTPPLREELWVVVSRLPRPWNGVQVDSLSLRYQGVLA